MKNEYDLIVSLGGNCYVAKQLQHRGMRPFSLALDWTLMTDSSCITKLANLFRTHFCDFCLYENISEQGKPDLEGSHWTYKFLDNKTGFAFGHHFHSPLSDRVGFDRDRSVIQRRIDRIYEKVSAVKNVLFILETAFPYDAQLLKGLYDALRDVFPGVAIDLYAIQFRAQEEIDRKLTDNIELSTYQRKVDMVDDVYGTSYEWHFLDGIRLAGVMKPTEKRRKSRIVKWKYSLWKALGKSLHKEGAGCVMLTLP